MYHGVGATPTLDWCREGMCVDPACWKIYPGPCAEYFHAQRLVACLETDCEAADCKSNFPDECRRGTKAPPAQQSEGFSTTTVLLLGVTTLAIGLWLGRRKNA